jgi:membrane protease YdiL (CAAX protease family)
MELERTTLDSRLPVPLDSGILYTVVAIYYVYVSQLLIKFQLNDITNLIISEMLFFAVPPIFLALVKKYDIRKTFRLKAPRPSEALLMVMMSPIVVTAGFCSGFIALLGVKKIFGRVYLAANVADYMSKGLFISILLVALLPAICEELLFRGMIQRGVERLGAGWSILLSGLLFGLFHFDFQRLAAQTLIGFIAAYVVYRTGSIFNGMILHFMNNGLLTLLSNYSANLADGMNTQVITDPFATKSFIDLAGQFNMTLDKLLGVMAAVLAVILAASLLVLFGMLYLLRSMTITTVKKPERIRGSAKGLLAGLPGLFLIALVYTALGLMLLNNEKGRMILQLLGMA